MHSNTVKIKTKMKMIRKMEIKLNNQMWGLLTLTPNNVHRSVVVLTVPY